MYQAVLSPNLTKKFQWEVSQIADNRFPCVTLLGGLSVNLNYLKTISIFPGRIIIISQFTGLSTALNMKVSICLESWLLLAIAIHEKVPFCIFPEDTMTVGNCTKRGVRLPQITVRFSRQNYMDTSLLQEGLKRSWKVYAGSTGLLSLCSRVLICKIKNRKSSCVTARDMPSIP